MLELTPSITMPRMLTTSVEPALMTEDEIAWLNAYHVRVRETLSPLVDRPTRDWLTAATKPMAPTISRDLP